MNKYIAPFYIPVILISIILFFILTNLLWLSLDTLPPAWDQSGHSLLSLSYYNSISKVASIKDAWNLLSISSYYPPFFHISTVPFLAIFGFSEDSVIFVNLFYLVILVLSIYGICKILFNRFVGVLAALLTCFYPFVFGLSRQCLIDFALLAIVCLVQHLILISEGGVKKRTNLLLGVVIGISLLIKSSAFIFFLITWILVYLKHYRKKGDIISLSIVLVIILVIVLPWYLTEWNNFLEANKLTIKIAKVYENDPQSFVDSILSYYRFLKHGLISSALLYFFFFGFLAFLIFDRRWKVFLILASWIIPAFIILSLYFNKDGRYIVPIVPAFAIITIGGISAIPLAFVRKASYSIVFLLSSIQFINLSFYPINYNYQGLVKEHPLVHRPVKQDWRITEILSFICKKYNSKNIVIGFLPDYIYFNGANFALYATLFNFPCKINRLGEFIPVTAEDIKPCDIIITKTGSLGPEHVTYYRDKFCKGLESDVFFNRDFEKIKEFDLPDNSKAIIYGRVRQDR